MRKMGMLLYHSYLYAVIYSDYIASKVWMINDWWILKFWKEICNGNRIIMPKGIQNITENLLAVWVITTSKLVVIRETYIDITRTFRILLHVRVGRESIASLVTRYGLKVPGIESRVRGEFLRTHQQRPWGPTSLLYNGYRVSPGSKAVRPWRWSPNSV
jgi:hypothetical protein